jgi:Domain of unknown function (DUF4232)
LGLLGISAVLVLVPTRGLGASTPRCATSSLRLDFVSSDAATSHEFLNLALRNVGSVTCHLKGFPRVGLLDVNARPINDPAFRETGFKQRNVVLRPWQRAYFTFGYAVSGPCVPNFFYAYGLRVVPPNATRGLVYYRGRFDVCGQSLSHPSVYPVRPTLNHL